MFIRHFELESTAIAFAKTVSGFVVAKYDWDHLANKMIKYWAVRY